MLLGRLYGPADLYYTAPPWNALGQEHGIAAPANPILSDLAFANLPWRAAVRESVVNGRFPFWNRFVLCGTPLLATAQAGIFHPSTWAGILLPLPLSWTFSCTFTLFLALLCAFVWLRDFGLSKWAAAVGATGWGFSTYIVFWNGWSVGPATASLPLLLLGLRRIASGGANGIGLTVAGFLLGFFGGHPESSLHTSLVGALYFAWELFGARRRVRSALARAAGAGVLAFLLGAPQLLPLAEAIPHSAEYASRARAPAGSRGVQSVPLAQASARLLPALLPFSHGVYGKSPVQEWRADGSGMPLAYAGAVLFPLAGLALVSRRFPARGRTFFAGAAVAGLLLGASAPGLIDVVTALPGLSLALNYRLVFLAALGLSGLAAFGVEEARSGASLAASCAVATVAIAAAFLASVPVLRARQLPHSFVYASFAVEIGSVFVLGAAALGGDRRKMIRVAPAALALLVAERGLEMRGTYPTVPRDALAPPFPGLPAFSLSAGGPSRIVGLGDTLRPNAAALYGLEDARGYESLVLDRFAETFPLWSMPQFTSFNRVDRLDAPFLSFLNARFAAAPPQAGAPAGWIERSRTRALAIFENPAALPRAFAPARIRSLPPGEVLADMRRDPDFGRVVRVDSVSGRSETTNPAATVGVRESGPDLVVTVSSASPVLIATSLPAWPGWSARAGGGTLATVTVNHAFFGFRAPAGQTTARVSYEPRSWRIALVLTALGILLASGGAARSVHQRRRRDASRPEDHD